MHIRVFVHAGYPQFMGHMPCWLRCMRFSFDTAIKGMLARLRLTVPVSRKEAASGSQCLR